MMAFKGFLLILAFFVTLLWITKLITDCVSAIYGNNFTEDGAKQDGIIRLYLIGLISILWPVIIMIW